MGERLDELQSADYKVISTGLNKPFIYGCVSIYIYASIFLKYLSRFIYSDSFAGLPSPGTSTSRGSCDCPSLLKNIFKLNKIRN